jgi:hypothetical protein
MVTLQRVILAGVAFGSVACATNPAPASSSASTNVPGRWSGSFKQTQMPTAQMGAATPNRGYGTITITPLVTGADRVRIELSVNAPVPSGTQVAWALFNGACGSAAPMVTGENQFPPMEIGGNGAGFVRLEILLPLDPRSAYHANVYWTPRARDLGDVMMCAPLKAGGR